MKWKIKKLITRKKSNNGFTLIELILYIALVTIFISGAIRFSWDVIYSREKAYIQRMVSQSASAAMLRISYEIRNAKTIQSISSTQLVINDGTNDTTINYNTSNKSIEITDASGGPYTLTNNQVSVTDLTFTDNSDPDTNSIGVNVNLTVTQANNTGSSQYNATTSLEQAIELNSQFNLSRTMLVDLTQATYQSAGINNRIQDISLQNAGDSSFTITEIFFSWYNTAGSENLTDINFNGGPNEWTGSVPTASTVDIPDLTLTTGSSATMEITFDSDVESGVITMNFILNDGSIHKSRFTVPLEGVSPSPVPSPTPTPSPSPTPSPTPASCPEVCQSLTYSTGTCRKNPAACKQNSETHEATGDTYCTGGNNADTCCCAP